MKVFLISLTFLSCTNISYAQDYNKVGSLLKEFAETKNDTAKVWVMHAISYNYLYSKPDSSAWFAQQALALSKKINYDRGIIRSLNDIGNALNVTGSYFNAIEILLQALEKSEKLNDENLKATSLGNIAPPYSSQGDYRQAISYTLRSLAIDISNNDTLYLMLDYLNLSDFYARANLPDSALPYANLANQLANQFGNEDEMGGIHLSLGNIYSSLNNDSIALPYYRKSVLANELVGNFGDLAESYYSMSLLFKRDGYSDSSFFYIKKAYETSLKAYDKKGMLEASIILASFYKTINSDSTVKYLMISIALKDSLFNNEKTKQVQSLTINEQLRQSKIEEEKEQAALEAKKNLQMGCIGAFIPLFFFIILAFGKKRVNHKIIDTLGLLGLLFFFQFISLVIGPYVDAMSQHNTFFKFLMQVCVAASLIPVKKRSDRWVKEKILHKTEVAIQFPERKT